MKLNPHNTNTMTKKSFNARARIGKAMAGVLALAIIAVALRAASIHFIPAIASALQSEQPQVGPGVPQVGSNAPKSAIGNNKAGSILFFNKYTSDAGNPSGANTLVSLTNTNPRDGATVRLFFVRDCQIASQFLNLAANQTRTLMMSIEDPGKTGYIVAVAVNAQGVPTQFNWLIGAASIKDAQGHEAAYNAAGVAKRAAGAAAISGNSSFTELNFNDAEYDKLPQLIALDSIQNQDPSTGPTPESAERTDVAVISPLADLRNNGSQALKFTAIAYDQTGRPYPQVFDNTCGLNATVANVWNTPSINTYIQPNRPGWGTFAATSADGAPAPLLGLSFSDGIGGPLRNARQMQALSRLDAFSIKVPINAPANPASDSATSNQPDAVGGALGASEMKAGSLLVFPRFTSGEHGSSRINLTNTHPTQRTRVRVVFTGLAGATEMKELLVTLNANQTVSINPLETASNQKGWVIAFAINSQSLPQNFNYLIGSAQVREQGGAAFGYNALPIR